jgi:hypothetical protein
MNPKMNDIMDFIDENHPTYDKFSTCLWSTNKTIAPWYCIGWHLTTTLATRCTYWINVCYYNKDPLKHHFRLWNWSITLEDPQHLTHKVLLPKKRMFINIIIKMIVYFTHNDLNANERKFSCKSFVSF